MRSRMITVAALAPRSIAGNHATVYTRSLAQLLERKPLPYPLVPDTRSRRSSDSPGRFVSATRAWSLLGRAILP